MNSNVRVYPSALKFWPATFNRLNQLRYRNSDIGRKLLQECFCRGVFKIVAELLAGRSANFGCVEVAIVSPLLHKGVVDLMRNQGEW